MGDYDQLFVVPAFNLAQYSDPVSVLSFVSQSVNIFVDSNFGPNFPRTIKATVMILAISMHLGITTQTAVYLTSTYILWFTNFVNLHGAT